MDFFTVDYYGEPCGTLFDAEHLLWLAGIAALALLLCLVHRKLKEKGRRIVRCAVGLTVFGIYLLRQLLLVILGKYGVWCLPLHLCGMALYIEVIDCLFPNRFTRELCYAVCMPGALMGTLYANWVDMPTWNFIFITSFVIHGLMVIYPLLALTGTDYRPDVRCLPWCFSFLVAAAVPVYFFNIRFGTNYMFLAQPSPGSPLELFEKWFGNPGYLLGFVIMIAIVWTLMYLPFVLIKKQDPPAGKTAPETDPV